MAAVGRACGLSVSALSEWMRKLADDMADYVSRTLSVSALSEWMRKPRTGAGSDGRGVSFSLRSVGVDEEAGYMRRQ